MVLAVVVVPGGARGWLRDTSGLALLFVGSAVALSLALHAVTNNETLRLLGCALLAVLIIYAPIQLFERASARRFIAETYAPLVIGEAGPPRTIIRDTLYN